MITSITRNGEQVAGLTIDSPESHYGQPVYDLLDSLATGDNIIVKDSNDDEGYDDGSSAHVEWTDGIWAIVQFEDWVDATQAIHLATGFVGRLTLDGAIYSDVHPETESKNWDDVIKGAFGKLGVDGAIDDWTGETIGLVFTW